MSDQQSTTAIEPADPALEPAEPRSERVQRHRQRTKLYTIALSVIALVVIIVAFAIDNDHRVKLGWVFGSSHLSLVWIILVSVIAGWMLGVSTGFLFRLRTRRHHLKNTNR